MTTKPPPKFYFSTLIFNSDYYTITENTLLSREDADKRYLIKVTQDTATVLETFNQGIRVNKPIQLYYAPTLTTGFFELGHSVEQNGTAQSLGTSGGSVFTSLLINPLILSYTGIYLINYTITINITTATTFTSQIFGLSKTSTGTTTANDFVNGCYQSKNIQEIYTNTSILSYSGYIKTVNSEQLYLLMKGAYGGSFTITGSAKAVRIG
jgi:hypothetical protein